MKDDEQLLDGIDKIRHIPTVMVQGRHDIVTPMMTAWDIHKRWPEAELNIVEDAGHASSEPGITKGIMEAASRFANHDR